MVAVVGCCRSRPAPTPPTKKGNIVLPPQLHAVKDTPLTPQQLNFLYAVEALIVPAMGVIRRELADGAGHGDLELALRAMRKLMSLVAVLVCEEEKLHGGTAA